jgi:hypothetical protein
MVELALVSRGRFSMSNELFPEKILILFQGDEGGGGRIELGVAELIE